MSMVIDMQIGSPRDLDPAAVQLLQILSNDTRRRIFLALLRGETCNCELVVDLAIPHNLVSHHLKRLRQTGLVQERRDRHADHWVHYVIDAEALSRALAALTSGLVPAAVTSRTPCCEQGGSDGEHPCPTCTTHPGASAVLDLSQGLRGSL